MAIILRFSGAKDALALAVKLYTWSRFSHVETVINDPIMGQRLYGALPSTGVNYRPIDSTDGNYVEEYEVTISNVKRAIYLEKLFSQKGKPYDFTALAGMVIHRDWGKDDRSWFCSELIAWAFNEAGAPLLRTESKDRVTPENLLWSPFLRRIS